MRVLPRFYIHNIGPATCAVYDFSPQWNTLSTGSDITSSWTECRAIQSITRIVICNFYVLTKFVMCLYGSFYFGACVGVCTNCLKRMIFKVTAALILISIIHIACSSYAGMSKTYPTNRHIGGRHIGFMVYAVCPRIPINARNHLQYRWR